MKEFSLSGLDLESCGISNLTPHDIIVFREDGSEYRIPRSSSTVHIIEDSEMIGSIQGIPVYQTRLVCDDMVLPEPQEGIFYIVPLVIAQYCKRKDFLVPHDYVRDSEGRIIGCKSFKIII